MQRFGVRCLHKLRNFHSRVKGLQGPVTVPMLCIAAAGNVCGRHGRTIEESRLCQNPHVCKRLPNGLGAF